MALSKNAAERLTNELLLSKGGGIYYDAARVAADESTATLFVGLGGTGADMLIRIKNEVKRRMILPQVNGKLVGDTPANIGFLAFDSDKSTEEKTWGIASFDKFGKEFCSISVDNLPKVVENRCKLADQGDPTWTWYEKISPDTAIDGANGRRQIGRLLFFENASKIYDKLQTRINELRRIGGGIKTINVMLVTGISGGTGAGTFIDMSYFIRKTLEDMDVENKQIFGFIVLPDVNLLKGGNKEKLMSNAYASLKELDYWMCSDDVEHDAVFEQNYGQGINEIKIKRRIFEFCHLLSAYDFDGNPLSYDKVISSMAEFVFAYVAGETGQQASGNTAIQQMYNNINGYIDNLSGRIRIPACYRYLAVGTHKLEIPYEEISTLLSVRLFERLGPILELRPTEETFKADMTALRLVPQHVIHNSLTEGIPASPISGRPAYQYTQIWGGMNNSYNRNAVFDDVNAWMARAFQTTITKNASNYANVQNGIFLNFVKDRMKSPDRGPQYLSALLKSDNKWSIIPTLEGIAKHCDEVAATCFNNRQAIEKRVFDEYNAGAGKILMKQKAIDGYLGALNEWVSNENAIHAYAERARVVRELRDRMLLYYDNIFSKLSDVLSALPEIFRQNLDYITIAQREAEHTMMLDDTKLVWPLRFEAENRVEFERLLNSACVGFLESLTENLSKWTGSDLERLDVNSGGNTDVPGFISRFISEQFGGLLNINMEDIMKAQLGGAEDLDDYLHTRLLRIRNRSIPMINIDSASRNMQLNEFAIASIPEDCENIKAAARAYYTEDSITKKVSREKTRLYYVKVISGIPLYTYSRIKDCARQYKQTMSIEVSRKGTHLNPQWADYFPTPYPEAAWSNDYDDIDIRKYNERMREGFDKCLAANIIILEDKTSTKRYLLKIADMGKAKLLETGLSGTINERLAQFHEIEEEIWDKNPTLILPQMGDLSTSSLETITRESILRLPRICEIIERQVGLIEKCTEIKHGIEDPKYFAFALICGLVVKQGFEIILKRSADSVLKESIYDITLDKPNEEYETYQGFRKLLDNRRRDEIEQIRSELLKRIANGSPEKEEVLERIDTIIRKYTGAIPGIQTRYDRAALDKRGPIQDILDFYSTIASIATMYKENYL